jgi:hypothetical protein
MWYAQEQRTTREVFHEHSRWPRKTGLYTAGIVYRELGAIFLRFFGNNGGGGIRAAAEQHFGSFHGRKRQ